MRCSVIIKVLIFLVLEGQFCLCLSQISVTKIVNSNLFFKKYDKIKINVMLFFVFLLLPFFSKAINMLINIHEFKVINMANLLKQKFK